MNSNKTVPLTFLDRHSIPQADLAKGISRSKALVSRVVRGELNPSKDTIDAILLFLSLRLRRRVTYEEVFGGKAA